MFQSFSRWKGNHVGAASLLSALASRRIGILMDNPSFDPGTTAGHGQLLTTLQGLLAIQATEVRLALMEAAQVVVAALRPDKADVFLYDPAGDSLVAVGTSHTPMGRKQIALGLNRLALSNGGETVRVYQSGESFVTRHLDQEHELPGIPGALGHRGTACYITLLDGDFPKPLAH